MPLDLPSPLPHFSPDSIERPLVDSGLHSARLDFRSFEHDPFGWVQSTLDRLGFEQGMLVKLLARMGERRSGPLATLAAGVLAVPLWVLGLSVPLARRRGDAGAVMEGWGGREERL